MWSVPAEPTIVRLGQDRVVLDPPWGLRAQWWSHVWPDPSAPGGWRRFLWPNDVRYGLPVAPVDLCIGHVVELIVAGRPLYAWVADAPGDRFVLVPALDAQRAVLAGRHAHGLWNEAELARVRQEWLDRLDRMRSPE